MDEYFLIFSLFFPRIVLLVYYFQGWYRRMPCRSGAMFFLAFLPRILILLYIYQNWVRDNIWFAAHLIVLILAYFGGGRETARRRSSSKNR